MALQEFLTLFIFYTFAFKKQKVPACLDTCKELIHFRAPHQSVNSLRGRRLKGKGKGVLGARETRGAREEGGREGGRETPARKPLFSPSRLLIMYAKITQL